MFSVLRAPMLRSALGCSKASRSFAIVNLIAGRFSMPRPEPIIVPNAAPPGGHYSPGIRHGGLLYVSGQLGVRPDGSHTVELPFEVQAGVAISNMLEVLAAAGLGASDLIRVTAYIVGVANWPLFNRIYADRLGEIKPARTVVPVPELHHGYLVELDALAAARSG